MCFATHFQSESYLWPGRRAANRSPTNDSNFYQTRLHTAHHNLRWQLPIQITSANSKPYVNGKDLSKLFLNRGTRLHCLFCQELFRNASPTSKRTNRCSIFAQNFRKNSDWSKKRNSSRSPTIFCTASPGTEHKLGEEVTKTSRIISQSSRYRNAKLPGRNFSFREDYQMGLPCGQSANKLPYSWADSRECAIAFSQ